MRRPVRAGSLGVALTIVGETFLGTGSLGVLVTTNRYMPVDTGVMMRGVGPFR